MTRRQILVLFQVSVFSLRVKPFNNKTMIETYNLKILIMANVREME